MVFHRASIYSIYFVPYRDNGVSLIRSQKVQHFGDRRHHRQDESDGASASSELQRAIRGSDAKEHGRLQQLPQLSAKDQAESHSRSNQRLSIGEEEEDETI